MFNLTIKIMANERLQLTVTKEKNEEFKLLFKRGSNNVEVEKCTKDELIMIKKVIEKVIL